MKDDPSDSDSLKIQTSGGSFQVTVPQAFGSWAEENGVTHVKTSKVGDKVVVRPVGATGTNPEQSITIPEDLPAENSEFIYSFLANVVQSYCVAGADYIDVSVPESFNDEAELAFEQIFRNIEVDELLEWNRSEKAFEVESLNFETYVAKVFRFVNDYLVHPLAINSFPEPQRDDIGRHEEKIDRYWALVTRMLGHRFLELERNEFPESLCGIYLGKYMEMIADLVKQLLELCSTFAERYGDTPELVEAVWGDLEAIFCGSGISADSFDENLKTVADRAYSLDIGLGDLQHQYNVLDARSEPLESLADAPRQFVEDGRLEPTAAYECGLLLGKIQHISRTLIQFPRSMAFTGLGAKNVAAIHGVQQSE